MGHRMGRWFRFYENTFDNPKVLMLSDREFRLWVRLLCMASENDGLIPPLAVVKARLNTRLDHLKAALNRLIEVGLIVPSPHGFEPHNWRKFQYKSDTSAPRMREKRARDVTSQNAITRDTDTDTDTEADSFLIQGRTKLDRERYAREENDGPFNVISGGRQ